MEEITAKRLDHLGVVAGVIKDLGIIEMIDERIPVNFREQISCGEAIAGMVINGLGFSDRPLTLTPQFFEDKALEVLFDKDIKPEHFNRFKLGRALDDVSKYGCDLLFSEVALRSCKQEGINCRFNSVDTTSFSLTGKYYEDSDENVIRVTHGYSKDHRPDLKQAVHELLVTQEGGIPLISKTFDGNASDNIIFQERAKSLIDVFRSSECPRCLVGDSKLYSLSNMETLREIPFITRVPGSIKEVGLTIEKAVTESVWTPFDEGNRYRRFKLEHYGCKQRWLVVNSDWARERANNAMQKAVERESKAANKTLKALQKHDFNCEEDAAMGLDSVEKKWKFHKSTSVTLAKKEHFAERGRPKDGVQPQKTTFSLEVKFALDEIRQAKYLQKGGCYVICTNVSSSELDDIEVIKAYKDQSTVERGFRFLKDPLFFTSSFFLKKPSRISGLLMVMTLALLVYSIAQRRLRNFLKETEQTIPNQIKQQTSTPTLRWVFQLLDGINVIFVKTQTGFKRVIDRVTKLRHAILLCFGATVAAIYGVGS